MSDPGNITLPMAINGGGRQKFITTTFCGIAMVVGLSFCVFTSWLDAHYLGHHPNAQPDKIWGEVRLYTRSFTDDDSLFVSLLPRGFRGDTPFVEYKGLNVDPLSVFVLIILVAGSPLFLRLKMFALQAHLATSGVQFTQKSGQTITRSFLEFSKLKLINISVMGTKASYLLLEGKTQNQSLPTNASSLTDLRDLGRQVLLQADGKSQNIVILIPRGAKPQDFARRLSDLIKLPLDMTDA